MRAALAVLRQARPVRIVVAVPVASAETCNEVRDEVNEVIGAWTPEPFFCGRPLVRGLLTDERRGSPRPARMVRVPGIHGAARALIPQ